MRTRKILLILFMLYFLAVVADFFFGTNLGLIETKVGFAGPTLAGLIELLLKASYVLSALLCLLLLFGDSRLPKFIVRIFNLALFILVLYNAYQVYDVIGLSFTFGSIDILDLVLLIIGVIIPFVLWFLPKKRKKK